MKNFSLFYRMDYQKSPLTMNAEAINDLSVDYIIETLTEDSFEQNTIKQMLTQIECNEELIKYRCDIFEDFLKFHSCRQTFPNFWQCLPNFVKLTSSKKIQTQVLYGSSSTE